MANQNYKGLFQNWEIGVATNVINRVRRDKEGLLSEEFDDLLQECLTHWYFSKNDYNASSGANIRTFMAKVVEHKLRHIDERLTSDKRRISMESVSLDEPILDEEDSPTFLDRHSRDETASNQQAGLELKIDISRILHKLTPEQTEICKLIGQEGMSFQEVSKAIKKHRATLYREIQRIKAIFMEERLHEFFKK